MAHLETTERIDQADRSDREAVAEWRDEARGEGRRIDSSLAGCLVFAAVVFLPAAVYFGFFAAVLIDEDVLQTYWFSDVIPESGLHVLRVIYSPLLWLMDQLDG